MEKKTGFVDSDSEYFNIINAARIKILLLKKNITQTCIQKT